MGVLLRGQLPAAGPTHPVAHRQRPTAISARLTTVSPAVTGTRPGAQGGRERSLVQVSRHQLRPPAPRSV